MHCKSIVQILMATSSSYTNTVSIKRTQKEEKFDFIEHILDPNLGILRFLGWSHLSPSLAMGLIIL